MRAMCGEGRYELAHEFKRFQVRPLIWHTWPESRKQGHFKAFLQACMRNRNQDEFVTSRDGTLVAKDKKDTASKPGQKGGARSERTRKQKPRSGKLIPLKILDKS